MVINQPVVRLPSSPGDIVSADNDGVMVVPEATSAPVVKIAARIETPLSRAWSPHARHERDPQRRRSHQAPDAAGADVSARSGWPTGQS